MKLGLSICVLSILFFFDCSKRQISSSQNDNSQISKNSMQNLFSYKNKAGDIEYEFTARLKAKNNTAKDFIENKILEINYKVSNRGKKNYLLYNRGHSGSDDTLIYVEPQKDEVTEISQRAFREPSDKQCPMRYMPIVPNASWLKAGQTVKNTIEVNLPLKAKTPFDDCLPATLMPDEVKKIRFCLGVSQVENNTVRIDEKGVIGGWQNVKGQQLLCSESVDLQGI